MARSGIADRSTTFLRLFGVGAVFWVGIMGSTALPAAVPALWRVTAPVVCPEGTERSVVVVYRTARLGRSSSNSRLFCLDGDRRPSEPAMWPTWATLFAMSLGVGVIFVSGVWSLLAARPAVSGAPRVPVSGSPGMTGGPRQSGLAGAVVPLGLGLAIAAIEASVAAQEGREIGTGWLVAAASLVLFGLWRLRARLRPPTPR